MKFDKKEIALSVGGVIASIAVAFLIYRMQQSSAAATANAQELQSEEIQSQLANQQSEVASLPSISVPTVSTTASTTDTTNQQQAPSEDNTLASIIAAFQSTPNNNVTNATTPIGAVAPLPYPTTTTIPPVTIPTVQNFTPTTLKTNTFQSVQ